MSKATIDDVRQFWDTHPLLTLEVSCEPGTRAFFETHNRIRGEVEKYSFQFWQFDRWQGKKVLDVGCGPGWLVRHFAANGADITGVDLSPRTVQIARQSLDIFGLTGTIMEGNAECLPFEDNSFDYVTSAGVLHHTPDTERAFREVARVLKPGGTAAIGLYYKNPWVFSGLFPIARSVLKMMGAYLPGRGKMMNAESTDEFVRMYDGDDNPVGKAYSVEECKQLAGDLEWLGHEFHYFPKRFIPGCNYLPEPIEKLLDNVLGSMIFFRLRKRA